jgi:hypothetical protein
MKMICSLSLILAFTLVACKKGPEPAQQNMHLSGAWQGSYTTQPDQADRGFVIIFKERGKMDVFDGDTLSGDKAKGTYMIEGSVLYGNFQYVQDGPVTNIRAELNATKDIVRGAWDCGKDGGSFVVDRSVIHSVALQPGSPMLP